MNLQTGDGGNITTLNPTVIGISDVGLAPAPLGFNYGAAAQGLAPGSPAYNNSWNNNWHYRAALSYITGAHQIKVGFNNAWGHFENLNYDVNPEYYTFTNGVPSAVNIKDSPYNIQVERRSRSRYLCAGPVDDEALVALRRDPVRQLQEQLPGDRSPANEVRAEPRGGALPRTGQHLVERHHAEAGRVVRRVWQRQNRHQSVAQQIPARLRDGRVLREQPLIRIQTQSTVLPRARRLGGTT